LFRVLPFWGESLVLWLWGGFRVGGSTLKFFFVIHFFFPWLVLLLVLFHLLALHEIGRSSSLGYSGSLNLIRFFPYYVAKDLLNLLFILFFFIFITQFPYILGDPEIFVKANYLIGPLHIVPEWYFLPFYAILRAIASKSLGVFFLILSLFLPFFLFVLKRYLSPLRALSYLVTFFLFTFLFFLG
jgi:ubiquinol-cytochrome c reductase cytochrome b subunit